MVICLEQGADLHMAQLMPLPLIVSCFSKIQIGFTFLVPVHLGSPGKGPLNGCCVVVVLCLFNCMMLHVCVPDQFGVGIVVPLVKDSLGNANDSAIYGGITLSVFLSKMFEYCLINKYENFVPSSDLQFGFKKKMACSHAIFALHQCVDNNNNTHLMAVCPGQPG